MLLGLPALFFSLLTFSSKEAHFSSVGGSPHSFLKVKVPLWGSEDDPRNPFDHPAKDSYAGLQPPFPFAFWIFRILLWNPPPTELVRSSFPSCPEWVTFTPFLSASSDDVPA